MEEEKQISINVTLPCYRETLNEECAKSLLNLFHGWDIISYNNDVIDKFNDYKALLDRDGQINLENETGSLIERISFKPSSIIIEAKNKNGMPFDNYSGGLNNIDILKEVWGIFAKFGQEYISEAEINLHDIFLEYQGGPMAKNMLDEHITFRKINIYTEIDGQKNTPRYTYGYTVNYNLTDTGNIYPTVYVAAITETDINLTIDNVINFNTSVCEQINSLKTYIQ